MNEVLDFLMSVFPQIAIGLFVAGWEMYSSNTSSGATWLVLGVCNAVLNLKIVKMKKGRIKKNECKL